MVPLIVLVAPYFVPNCPAYQRACFPQPAVIAAWKAGRLAIAIKDPPRDGLLGPPPVRNLVGPILWAVWYYDDIEEQKRGWKPTNKPDELKERQRLLRAQRETLWQAVLTWRSHSDHLPADPNTWLTSAQKS
jgi:hypothetical protein